VTFRTDSFAETVTLATLIGLSIGMAVSAILIAASVLQLDGPVGAAIHYGLAALLAVLVARPSRWRPGASPFGATILFTFLFTFAIRRWLTVWINLCALDLGSGPAGRLTALVFPLEGLLLAVAFVTDLRAASAELRPRHTP
jgi:hypothetical protein